MPSRDPLARTGRDGCQCPAWVLRCAHWEGWILHLVDLPKHHELCDDRTDSHKTKWSVSQGRPGHAPGHVAEARHARFRTDSLPDALEEFHKREEALLREPANA